MKRTLLAALVCAVLTASCGATGLPTADKAGSKDSPILKRYEGSLIISYEFQSFAEFSLPLSPLAVIPGKMDAHNNHASEPKQKRALEGAHTRIVYLLPANRTPLEVVRNYQQEIRAQEGKILFECKDFACGGDAARASSGGGGEMSIAMYLASEERVKDEAFSTGWCAQLSRISDQRYTTAEIPSSGASISVLAFNVNDHGSCGVLADRTVAIVDIVETKAREQKMISLSSEEMAKDMATTGSVALYGIYFDVNKTELKPESEPALAEIAKLMKATPTLKLLVVGHTDHVGTLPFNVDLSQRRAAAVVEALVTRFQLDRSRLTPMGVAYASPITSNKTEEGRAKNRRVELVEN